MKEIRDRLDRAEAAIVALPSPVVLEGLLDQRDRRIAELGLAVSAFAAEVKVLREEVRLLREASPAPPTKKRWWRALLPFPVGRGTE